MFDNGPEGAPGCGVIRYFIKTVVRNSAGPPNQTGTNSRDEKADLAAEERSEDEGMTEHANKAADPVAWAANRAAADTGPGPARGRQSS